MEQPSTVANNEVILPVGVVSQDLYLAEKHLRLRHRYPLGIFLKTDTLDAYKAFIREVDNYLETSANEKDDTEARVPRRSIAAFERSLIKRKYVERANRCIATIFTIAMDHVSNFNDKINIMVCQRMRIDPLSHQPVVDRWIEFADTELAPQGYMSLWSVARTIFLPIAVCLRTNELVGITLPPIHILKLLPRINGEGGIADTIPPRLQALVQLKNAEDLMDAFVMELRNIPVSKSFFWDSVYVKNVVESYEADFSDLGISIFFCQMFTLATVQRLFQWIEFVDKTIFVDYKPQYEYVTKLSQNTKRYVLMNFNKYRVLQDHDTNEYFLQTANTQRLRIRSKFFQKSKYSCLGNWYRRPQPRLYWNEDTV